MTSNANEPRAQSEGARAAVRLYRQYLHSWNERDAALMASLFVSQGSMVGFDGSVVDGAEQIETTTAQIFADHQTAPYVGLIRDVRELAPGCVLLRADAGMPLLGQRTLNRDANAVHALVVVQEDGAWSIAHFHCTPAQFHGRPHLSEALSNELQQHLMEDTSDGS